MWEVTKPILLSEVNNREGSKSFSSIRSCLANCLLFSLVRLLIAFIFKSLSLK